METYTVHREVIPESVVPGLRLGRHVHHDSRSLAYRPRTVVTPVTTHRRRLIPILNQGNLGSCTGNAETGVLGSEGVNESIAAILANAGVQLNEDFAVALYSSATNLDNYQGTYPPTDTGSDGLSVSKAAASNANPASTPLISGYTNASTVDEIIAGLQEQSGVVGINWYDSFDHPDANGVVALPTTARIRGGHELHVLNVNMEDELFELPNSWGTGWGVNGTFFMPFDVMQELMAQEGDANFPVPLTQPAPTPTPPSTFTKIFTSEAFTTLNTWAGHHHTGENKRAAQAWTSGKAG